MYGKITPKQIQLIHVGVSALGWDDEQYRDVIQSRYGVSSSKDMSYDEAQNFLNLLKKSGFKLKSGQKQKRTPAGVVKMASPKQRALIDVLKSNVRWRSRDGFQLWLERRMKLKRITTAAEAHRVIEGLKGMTRVTSEDIENRELPFPGGQNADQWRYDTEKERLEKMPGGGHGHNT